MNDIELKKLHGKILEIAEYFDNFCKDNSIVYYLMGGTALGAMRHKGFIPWDDDFDVFMDSENYNKFLEIVDEKLDKDRFYFQKEDTKEWGLYFSKIRMNGTTFIEKDLKNIDMHHGIYIDIMCLNNTSELIFIRYIQYFSARVLNTRVLAIRGYETDSKLKKLFLQIAKYSIIDSIKKILLKIVRGLNSKESSYIGHFFGRAPFRKTSFPIKYLGKPRYVKFEHLSLPVAKHVEEYLKVRYGDRYMELPSEAEKAKYPSHAYIVDVSKSYKEFKV
ncbi:MAG TPA: lipopolysaccharide cholinephosphotransferase [Candidatus Nanopusillus sp.]|nr:lipopolysaccharide cholinephosphotransferase [Candidatus Nanopusillus sp.]